MNSHYRGVAFSLHSVGPGQWLWTAGPGPACGDGFGGEYLGTEDNALKTCFRAIDAALEPKDLPGSAACGVRSAGREQA